MAVGVVGRTKVNLMQLGCHKLSAPGLRNAVIRSRLAGALQRSGGNLTTYPIDHETEHGRLAYFLKGMLPGFDPGALVDVAKEGRVLAMAVLPSLGQVVGQHTKGDMPLIWKLNRGAGANLNGDSVTVRLYSNVEAAMRAGIDNGAITWGATYYHGSQNAPEMLRQIAEMDEAGAKLGLGGVVWNYPRGSQVKAGDAEVFYQLDGFEAITNAAPASLVLVKEKVSTRPGKTENPVTEWEAGDLEGLGWGKPGAKGVNEDVVRRFLTLDRGAQIQFMVAIQHDRGIGSLMSGGAPQKPDQFLLDVADGLGTADAGTLGFRHLALIAGRSTTAQILRNPSTGLYNLTGAIAHFKALDDAAPRVTIEV